MSEKNPTADGYAPSPSPESADSTSRPVKRRNPVRRAIIAAVVGAGLIAALQWSAVSSDHQNANIGSVVVGLLTTIYVVLQFHRLQAASGNRLLVPAVCLFSIGAFFAAFEFDGFSGELWPQFKLRFGGKQPLVAKPLGDAVSETSDVAADSSEASDTGKSIGFLAGSRNGVIGERDFAVPTSVGQIKTLWNQGIGEGWSSFAVAKGRAVTLEQRDELECVTCYRLGDGELVWSVNHQARHQNGLGGNGPRSTPTIDGSRVYAQGATGKVWCLDLNSGDVIWTVDLLELAGWNQEETERMVTWGRSGSPLLIDGTAETASRLCVLPYGGPETNVATGRSLIALDAETGEVQWAAGEDQISFASPVEMTLAGVRQIVTVNESTVSGHQVGDGKVLWTFSWPGRSNGDANCASAVWAGKDRFLVGKGYGGGSALVEIKSAGTTMSAEPVWISSRVLKTKFTHACIDGDVAYGLSNGSLEAVHIDDGEKIWQQPRSSRFQQGQVLLVDDVLVAQAETGEVALVAADPSEYRELLRIPAMDSKTWNVPTVAGRHLLVRNDRQAICFLLPERED